MFERFLYWPIISHGELTDKNRKFCRDRFSSYNYADINLVHAFKSTPRSSALYKRYSETIEGDKAWEKLELKIEEYMRQQISKVPFVFVYREHNGVSFAELIGSITNPETHSYRKFRGKIFARKN
ncbi:hypothetical protein J4456_01720 [Candidatus Pacearchaeota archaeon]|nr:hypothetical protein [Candidatus Pacearchaeota archaeon]